MNYVTYILGVIFAILLAYKKTKDNNYDANKNPFFEGLNEDNTRKLDFLIKSTIYSFFLCFGIYIFNFNWALLLFIAAFFKIIQLIIANKENDNKKEVSENKTANIFFLIIVCVVLFFVAIIVGFIKENPSL